MALIELIDVTKKFGSHVVLDGVNFALDANERVAVIGKNGGGKSTLMKIIAGLCEIDEGHSKRAKHPDARSNAEI